MTPPRPLRATLAVLVLIVASSCNGDDPAVLLSTERGVVGFDEFTEGEAKSFGVFLCASGGEVTLRSIEAMASEGEIELLGSFLFQAADGFVGATEGFPPEGVAPDALVDIDGAVVDTDCGNPTPELRSQIVVGAARTGPGGGMIEGLRVVYEDGELELPDFSIVLCGDQDQFCQGLDTEQ